MIDTFECELCHGVFEKGWSDEECEAEAQAIWGGPVDDPALVCDTCWQTTRPDQEPSNMVIREMWERSRAAWQQHSGRKLPLAKTSAQIIDEAVQAVLNRSDTLWAPMPTFYDGEDA